MKHVSFQHDADQTAAEGAASIPVDAAVQHVCTDVLPRGDVQQLVVQPLQGRERQALRHCRQEDPWVGRVREGPGGGPGEGVS